MCLIALIKFCLKFILPLAIIGVVVYFVYFRKQVPDAETTTMLGIAKFFL